MSTRRCSSAMCFLYLLVRQLTCLANENFLAWAKWSNGQMVKVVKSSKWSKWLLKALPSLVRNPAQLDRPTHPPTHAR